MGDQSQAFGLYLSCVAGLPVARFGSRVLIGAERSLTDRTEIQYTPETIVAIPAAEARQYAREYRRAIESGSVMARTAAAWAEQEKHHSEVGAPRIPPTAEPPPEDESEAHGHPESSRL